MADIHIHPAAQSLIDKKLLDAGTCYRMAAWHSGECGRLLDLADFDPAGAPAYLRDARSNLDESQRLIKHANEVHLSGLESLGVRRG